VQNIFSTDRAFAALKLNGRVISWGDPSLGGDSSRFEKYLRFGVQNIVSNRRAFAALTVDGRVITWGNSQDGRVEQELKFGVKNIFSTRESFAALKLGGKVITWGDLHKGSESSKVSEFLKIGVIKVQTMDATTFRATKADNSYVEWGVSVRKYRI